MVKVVKIQVYFRVLTGPDSGETEVIEQTPTSQDIDDIKLDIARIVKNQVATITPKPEYYYVVLKVASQRSFKDKHGVKGRFAYRTVVPKVML